ncbi:MAG: glycosyltransferase family 4 protein [Ekhidna sp.]|nr:glycosyltransferase family 4 protein [Ekhidna sp.]
MERKVKSVVYLSGAPRVSTSASASAGGPRSHILGIIKAFQKRKWIVYQYIVGDLVPKNIVEKDTSNSLKKSLLLRFASDFVRLFLRLYHQRRAYRSINAQVDLLYERYAAYQEIGSYIRKKTGAKWILESNGLYYYEASSERKAIFFRSLLRRFEKSAYKKCDLLVCISHNLKAKIVNELQIDPSKIIVVSNGVDADFFKPSETEKTASSETITIGFVGTLIYYQRLDLLLHAAHNILNRNVKIKVVIVGDGIEFENWKNLADDLGIASKVEFTGKVSRNQIPSIIESFDWGYSVPDPTLAGNYVSPLKLYEYMAMGTPVIAYPTEDASKLINEEIGLIVEKFEVEEIEKTILDAIKLDSNEFGKKCRDIILKEHSWEGRLDLILRRFSEINND